MPRPTHIAANQIVENIDRIGMHIAGKTEHDYRSNPLLVDAVERCIERISEASRSIPDNIKNDYPTVPWRDIATIGNLLRHNYDTVASPIIWSLACLDAPALRQVMAEIATRTAPGETS